MSDRFTGVEIAFYPEYMNCWLRFGAPDIELDLDRRRSLALFKSGKTFGYVQWTANVYGTQKWQLTVVRTVSVDQQMSRIEGIRPGGETLLAASGKVPVKRILSLIDALEDLGFDPAEMSVSYFRHMHNRIVVRQPIRVYSNAQHNAVLAARKVWR